MDKILQITLLYDFYGELFTAKQRHIFELYYQNDLSLSEIADQIHTSRQAVHDLLKRCEKILLDYEAKLHLVEKFVAQRDLVQEIRCWILDLEKSKYDSTVVQQKVEAMKTIIDHILEE